MPLTETQLTIAKLIAKNRDEGSHLAGGSAMHFEVQSFRFSEDLDYFHDSLDRVSRAFELDKSTLIDGGFEVHTEIFTPAYIRATVKNKRGACKVEWARDSSWRFMPVQTHPQLGYVLHPIDLAINKLLALVGRDEPRDFLDVLYTHSNQLPLGAQCWAACGKDPGFNPNSLLELLKRKGKYRPEDFARLHLADHFKIDLVQIKERWLTALASAETFVASAPAEDLGCLYYSASQKKFIEPVFASMPKDVSPHFGCAGGIIPSIVEE